MIVLDTETTGFLKPGVVPIEQQPEIIEFAAIRLDGQYTISGELEMLIRPKRLPIPPDVEKITGILSKTLEDKHPFPFWVPALQKFFLGETFLVGHNLSHDVDCLGYELTRLNRAQRFPWPYEHIDTVELTMDLEAKRQKSARLKLSELYVLATGREPPAKHRAMDDVRSLVVVVQWLHKLDGRI